MSDYIEAATKLGGRGLGEAVAGFMQTVVNVQRKEVLAAAEEFIEGRKHKTESENGKRAQLSSVYAGNVAMWLREFAKTFPGTAVCDLTKAHLDTYLKGFANFPPKAETTAAPL